MRHDFCHTIEPGKQCAQRRLHLHHDACAQRIDQPGVAAELQSVPQTLLALQQDGAALQGGFTQPQGLSKLAQLKPQLGVLPTPFEFPPASREVTHQQSAQAKIPMGLCVVRRKRNRLFVTQHGFRQLRKFGQHNAAVVPGFGIAGVECDGAVQAVQRRIELAKFSKQDATIVMGLEIAWRYRDCPLVAFQRLLAAT